MERGTQESKGRLCGKRMETKYYGKVCRCKEPEGHDGKHRAPVGANTTMTWSDEQCLSA